MITEEYMDNFMREKAWCPKYKDITMIPCPTPPVKGVLLQKFWDFIDAHN
jgi:hypothetical protein